MHRVVVAAASVLALLAVDRPAFEVASVKRYVEGSRGEAERKITSQPDGLIASRETIEALIEFAYRSGHSTEISGPALLHEDDYDIAAKAGRTVTVAELREMLQSLLAERFKLVLHRETKSVPVPYLVASFSMVANMARFCETLSMFADRAVVDRTGLTGTYEVTLKVPLDPEQRKLMTPGRPFAGFGPTAGINSAVEELGLKLETRKAPVDFLVIDHIERPTEN